MALAILAVHSEWFTDNIGTIGQKDTKQQLRGKWIIELAEFAALAKAAGMEVVKSFISTQVDNYRPPYGRLPADFPRGCVFAATTNVDDWGQDETGARRFWPITCGEIKTNDIERDRDLLWGEAVALYRRGETFWLETSKLAELAEQEQSDRYNSDAWEPLIRRWLKDPIQSNDKDGHPVEPWDSSDQDSVTVTDILIHCIKKAPHQLSNADSQRIGRCLKVLKWKRRKVGPKGQQEGRYFPPSAKL